MALPRIILTTTDKAFAKTAKNALGGAVVLSMTDSGEKALKALDGNHAFTTVISDMALSGMDGRAFLAAVKEKHPRIARIAVIDAPEFEQAAELINAAGISRLLTKPCDPQKLVAAVADSISRHRREKAESKAMKSMLIGCVKMLVDLMELTHPEAVSRSKRILRQAQDINRELKAMSPQYLDMAVLLSHIGCMGLPKDLLHKVEKGSNVTREEMKLFRSHPEIASRLLGNIPRMGKMAEIVRHQNTPFSQKPPLGARILKVCIDVDQIRTRKGSAAKALAQMRKRPDIYDPAVVKAMAFHLEENQKAQCAPITVADLKPGMVMRQDMVTRDGAILLHKGEPLSEASCIRLQTFHDLLQIRAPLYAVLPGGKTCTLPSKEE
ncbi:MAG: response regulator [Desulfovibrionaceae bacterium]|nr:response regulator [Desulfovibrionaceae bacterium]